MINLCPLCDRPLKERKKGKIEVKLGYVILKRKYIHLTPNEAKILEALINASPRFVTIFYLLESSYTLEADWPMSKTVEVVICRIRKKLIGTGFWIENNHGIGYRFIEGEKREKTFASDSRKSIRRERREE